LTDGHGPLFIYYQTKDACYVNSIAGQIQVNKWLHGSSGQTELYPGDIAQFQIWLAPIKVQKAIRKMVEDAFKARNDAKALLARAQRAVEVAIEEGEAAGLAALKKVNRIC